MFRNLIPKIFYDELASGLAFFVDGLGFQVSYQDADIAVIERDGAKAYLVRSPGHENGERPDLGIDTDDIDAVFAELSARAPQFLHPNADRVALRPWGAREFAMLDPTTVCVTFRQWPSQD